MPIVITPLKSQSNDGTAWYSLINSLRGLKYALNAINTLAAEALFEISIPVYDDQPVGHSSYSSSVSQRTSDSPDTCAPL